MHNTVCIKSFQDKNLILVKIVTNAIAMHSSNKEIKLLFLTVFIKPQIRAGVGNIHYKSKANHGVYGIYLAKFNSNSEVDIYIYWSKMNMGNSVTKLDWKLSDYQNCKHP